MITVIDYGIGNLKSVVKAFEHLGVPVRLSSKPDDLFRSEGIVLPGVGAFGEGMNYLRKNNLDQVIIDFIHKGKPFLGICLGFQLLFSSSEEDKEISGLDLIKGEVKKFDTQIVKKVPHIGWNRVELVQDDPLFRDIVEPRFFYFVHSYFAQPEEEEVIIGKTTYGSYNFASVVRKDNIWGIQCHPEKSSDTGLAFLKNFSEVVNKWK